LGKVSRLSHKQIEAVIKRDELRDFLGEAQDWLKAHLENALIGVVVLALLIFGSVYFLKNRHEDSIKAAIQLSNAEQLYARAAGSGDASAFDGAKSAYEQVRTAFPSSDEAVAAELGLANLLFSSGKAAEAQSAYANFISNHPGSPLLPVAQSGQAASLEASGKLKEAADAYLSLANQRPLTAVSASSYVDAARCLEAIHDTQRLKAAVEGLEKLDADKMLPDVLKSRLQALKKRL